MEELLTRTWEELIGRQSGPLYFRLILQPVVAAILAARSGSNDAKLGRPAFFWAVLRKPKKSAVASATRVAGHRQTVPHWSRARRNLSVACTPYSSSVAGINFGGRPGRPPIFARPRSHQSGRQLLATGSSSKTDKQGFRLNKLRSIT